MGIGRGGGNRSRTGGARFVASPVPQICLAAVLLLTTSGCAVWERLKGKGHAEPPATVEKPQAAINPPPPPPPPPRPKHVAREAPPHEPPKEPERIASIDPNSLIGLQPAAVEKLLGSPSNVTKSDPSLVWTYAGQGCSFQIFFYPDLKTASFHALKYGSTGAEQSENCVRSILTVKSNGPG
ncbi:MAG TPA: hypothetical protein VMU01_12470 [Rhizomicrobium sp.]|nr:hypothetical protein [Rhizomicrobium sp.]